MEVMKMKYQIGQVIYNRGDMANHEGWFAITAVHNDQWGKSYDMEEIKGDRKSTRISEHMIHDVDTNNGHTRFVTKEARDTMKKAMFEAMTRR